MNQSAVILNLFQNLLLVSFGRSLFAVNNANGKQPNR